MLLLTWPIFGLSEEVEETDGTGGNDVGTEADLRNAGGVFVGGV